jgi:tripartite ATP-independent transporter DctP family solute receptor
MKKSYRVISLLLGMTLVSGLFAGCGSSGSSTSATTAAATTAATTAAESASASGSSSNADVTIKFSLSHASTEPAVLAANSFAEEVKTKSNGAISVEVYPENQLGSERDVVEGLQLHTVEMCDPANAVLTNFVPETTIFELPMLFENKQHVYKVLDDIGMQFSDACEAQGFKLLGWFDMGSRNIMTVSKVVNRMDDMKGLKIRTQESDANMAGMASFGASPTPMAYNELYTALESGVLDGAEAANTNYYLKAFYEVAPNWAIVGWLECVNPVIMDLSVWNSLTEEQKTIIQDAADAMIQKEREDYAASEDEYLEKLKEANVNITYPDKAPFKEASQTAYEQFYDKVGGKEKIDAILNYNYQ